jgi:cbb3-type cytochrome oxidase cytochrome c subunit
MAALRTSKSLSRTPEMGSVVDRQTQGWHSQHFRTDPYKVERPDPPSIASGFDRLTTEKAWLKRCEKEPEAPGALMPPA